MICIAKCFDSSFHIFFTHSPCTTLDELYFRDAKEYLDMVMYVAYVFIRDRVLQFRIVGRYSLDIKCKIEGQAVDSRRGTRLDWTSAVTNKSN